MKLKNFFKILGLSLFLVALIIFMLSQNEKIHPDTVLFPVAFGSVLAFSGMSLVTGELIGKIEKLEERAFRLEEEVCKLKEKSNTDKEN